MNVVLDTNVLIADFIARGLCHTLVEQCLGVHTVITSEFILRELREKLTGKFKYSDADASAIQSLLLSKMRVVNPISLANNVCRDPDDDKVLGTALMGKAVCIITGDQDLLILKKFGDIDILAPSEFEAYEVKSMTDPPRV